MSAHRCPVCGAPLDGRRRQTRYCSGRCRAEASPERRILSGVGADAYESAAAAGNGATASEAD